VNAPAAGHRALHLALSGANFAQGLAAFGAIGLVAFVAATLHVVSFGPVAAQQAEGEMRERRAAQMESRSGHGEATTVRLPLAPTPGRPQDEIPIPPHSRLVGNTVHGDDDAFNVRMALEAEGEVADVLAFYRDELPVRGWEEVLMWRWRTPGTAVPIGELSTFCQSADGPRLIVVAIPASSAGSRVFIRIDSGTTGPCAEAPPGGGSAVDRAAPFPTY